MELLLAAIVSVATEGTKRAFGFSGLAVPPMVIILSVSVALIQSYLNNTPLDVQAVPLIANALASMGIYGVSKTLVNSVPRA